MKIKAEHEEEKNCDNGSRTEWMIRVQMLKEEEEEEKLSRIGAHAIAR